MKNYLNLLPASQSSLMRYKQLDDRGNVLSLHLAGEPTGYILVGPGAKGWTPYKNGQVLKPHGREVFTLKGAKLHVENMLRSEARKGL